MQSPIKYFFHLLIISAVLFISCKNKAADEPQEEEAEVRTPVTITAMQYDGIEEYIELNATSTFLQKSYVKANLTGYIKSVNIHFGSFVNAGQVLFSLQTKESEALGNTINKLDPNFKFSGINYVKTTGSGYITELDHQAGDYVQDGEQLAVISDMHSFVFLMDMPYEYKRYVMNNKIAQIILPDGERLQGVIQTSMPFVDSVSQTQAVAIKINAPHQIPPGLVAKVKIIKVLKASASSLLKAAVLSDETQSEFWVMKLINDSTAIKVPVKTGVETTDKIEILSPEFSPKDRILLTGNFGLPDTALVIAPGPEGEKKTPPLKDE
ncbi:MAG: efflux RND transporter periplasmic adaptor subunit [Ginsengibacter sp.]